MSAESSARGPRLVQYAKSAEELGQYGFFYQPNGPFNTIC
ncbi:hypothetical protein ALQ48_01733 [Pseudomonas coronafaciens pv. zizaniae]|nr:Unknown protein sequence [Pseudomonas coronafaciens pv. oryzae]KPY02503.1 Unknown protein sequence [Pseudomonas coronafaciens pv. oryzae]RMO02272.1 hypothetical protein ALQ48_01733 [Pseudomonas coronafaciens pv. zizaniae]RMS99328.1 hypothetical protein ALP55_02880 [Pseudomonas coronafaciens pv. oryzae]